MNIREIIEVSSTGLSKRWLVFAMFSQVSARVLEVTWFSCVIHLFFSRIDRVRCRCSSFSTRQDERSRCVYSRIVTYKFSWALLSWTTETRSKKPTVKRCVKQTFLCVVDETLQDNRSFRFFFTHTDATFTYLCATITIFPSYSIYSMDISIYIYVIYIECGAIRKDSELRYSCNTHWYIDSIDKWETARKEKYK